MNSRKESKAQSVEGGKEKAWKGVKEIPPTYKKCKLSHSHLVTLVKIQHHSWSIIKIPSNLDQSRFRKTAGIPTCISD